MRIPIDTLCSVPGHILNTMKVGGMVQRVFRPGSMLSLQNFLSQNRTSVHWIGLGSNSLIDDHGLEKPTIVIRNTLNAFKPLGKKKAYVMCGMSCSQVARWAAQNAYNMDFLATIPGTIGGALRMNAGCYQQETWSYVQSVVLLHQDGTLTYHTTQTFKPMYRHVLGIPPNTWFVAVILNMPNRDHNATATIRTLLQHRQDTQPAMPHCGSVFKNQHPHYAGVLIEKAGLKGMRVGGAMVSLKHANFIINMGNATCLDVKMLMQHVQESVYENSHIWLTPEVHFLSDEIN
jgi:UDP-N-acetylmuramate dehydrogenase